MSKQNPWHSLRSRVSQFILHRHFLCKVCCRQGLSRPWETFQDESGEQKLEVSSHRQSGLWAKPAIGLRKAKYRKLDRTRIGHELHKVERRHRWYRSTSEDHELYRRKNRHRSYLRQSSNARSGVLCSGERHGVVGMVNDGRAHFCCK